MDDEKKSETAAFTDHQSRRIDRSPYARMVQNFCLVWLDECIDEVNNDNCRNTVTELQQVVNAVHTFTDVDECIDFVTDIQQEKAFMVISSALSRTVIPLIQDIPQVSCVYIFCKNKARHEQWAQQWSKVKGVFTVIAPMCDVLRQNVKESNQNMVSLSFVKMNDDVSTQNLDKLDSSFMYTQILKEILLTIDFEQQHIDAFLTYCREQVANNNADLKNIEKFQKEYRCHEPIWWYTYGSFLYSILNRALRLMEVDLIIKMGFFIRDLHQHISALHSEQYGGRHHSESFIVYRGQGLSLQDFDQLMKTKGGLMSFNNLLSTSLDRLVSLAFADSNQQNPDLIGVLFEITINPSISSTAFADIRNVSAHEMEEEVLFSMHAVFRIGQIQQIDENNRLWQVELTLTSDNDPLLQALTESMRKGTRGPTGWKRLGNLMIVLGHFNKAEELYKTLLQETTNEYENTNLFHQLGLIKSYQGNNVEAIEFYEKAVKLFSPTDSELTTTCHNIGMAYHNMGEYSKALAYYEKALETKQKTLHPNHRDLAISRGSIGLLYSDMGEYSKALSYSEKALEIFQKTLPPNHPDLATCYSNIGSCYHHIGEYAKAFSYYRKALEIEEKILPSNHPALATSYSNIGVVYDYMGEYSKALSYYEKALEIGQSTLPPNYPALATSYDNIGEVYSKMGELHKALFYDEKAVEIRQNILPSNHPDFAYSYNNIGMVCLKMGEYSKALSYYEKALEIGQSTCPPNYPELAILYNNIGGVYSKMGELHKALAYYEKALESKKKTLPPNHPGLATTYNNIGTMYFEMRQYSKALPFFERAFDIGHRALPANHPTCQLFKINLEMVRRLCN